MEILRFASNEKDWTDKERDQYDVKIRNQTLLSLVSIISTVGILIYLTSMVFINGLI